MNIGSTNAENTQKAVDWIRSLTREVAAGEIYTGKVTRIMRFGAFVEILPGKDSEEVLQAVLKVLTDHSEIKKILIEGHTDNRGGVALNKKLSGARAVGPLGHWAAHALTIDDVRAGQRR